MAALVTAVTVLPLVLLDVQRPVFDAFDLATAVVEPMTAPVLAASIVAAGWAIWAWLVTAIVGDLAAAVRHRPPRLLPRPLHAAVTGLAGVVITTLTSHGPVAAPPPAAVAAADLTVLPWHTATAAPVTAVPGHDLVAVSTPQPGAAVHMPVTVTVKRGDTLWRIADRSLGDPQRWPEIYHDNAARYDRGGRMRGGNHIEPGWVLILPTSAAPAPPADPTGPPPGSAGQAGPAAATPSAPAGAQPTPATTAPAAPAAGATTAPPAGQHDGTSAEQQASDHRPGVTLRSGSWVDLALAVAIAAAVGLVWAHHRRRYRLAPLPAAPRDTATPPAPMPPVVVELRRHLHRLALRRQRAATPGRPVDAPEPTGPGIGDDDDLADDTAVDDPRLDAAPAPTPAPSLVTPALTSPVGALWPPAGLGVTGPRAADAARGILTSALAAGGVTDPAARTRVIMPAGTATALLATTDRPATARLTVPATLSDALDLLEAEILHRTRLVEEYQVETTAALRDADPLTEPVEPLLLIADATGPVRARVAAVLSQGHRLDIHGLLLGPWPAGTTVTVADDGTIEPADDVQHPGPHLADLGRVTVLGPAETIALLSVLAESHTGTSDGPTTPAADTETETAGQPAGGITPAAPQDSPTESADTGGQPDVLRVDAPPGPAAPGTPVQIRLLGTPEIVDADTSKGAPRAKAVELLVYLAAHDGHAHLEAIIDDLLPDAPLKRAPHRLHTYVSDLRQVLRRTGGPGDHVLRTGARYHLNRDLLDIDLWRMQQAAHDATTATDPAAQLDAWQRVIAEYQGDLADHTGYEWIEPYQEAARRQYVDAALAIAEHLTDRPAEALPVLDAAIARSPYTEALYQAAMRAHAALGDAEAIRRLRRTLTHQLADLDTEPADETLTVANHLIANISPAGAGRPGQRHRITDRQVADV
ncbi:BTAD domain-containing putative transcriptional regulator [Dactylosporangium matsuzakiense]|uniref:LysM domain-containing protein n=1 Tax=Dactylosporangium matsuzakiense TaxID=53360 RepID=A0A9W6KP12_9ACTN|nr:BTAD domain-containing putative transcriptional regulator [Dactylosporangium matsuzakiense]UWZ44634.1 LysM peptidoglycan-binding domain-containing protein [Dactylosporangium matsuzakiense]GLL04642.1 hypothetical protein GCM10017581_063890 [Dactylosporangium matsuzakiense]